MALSFGTSTAFRDNAFCDSIEISAARDVSGIQNPWGKVPDLALELEYPGKDGNPFKTTLGGEFKRDANGTIVGFGGAFPIEVLLSKSTLFATMKEQEKKDFLQIIELGKLPKKFLDFLVGKTLHKVSYVKGYKEDDPSKLAYSSFNQLGWTKEQVIKAFNDGVAKGYPKNYDPTAKAGAVNTTTEGSTDFPAGGSAADEDVF
jgi:hypothetical protein